MKIELSYDSGIINIKAFAICDGHWQEVARGTGTTLEIAVKAVVSRFADMQRDTVDALNASGVIRYVGGTEGEAS